MTLFIELFLKCLKKNKIELRTPRRSRGVLASLRVNIAAESAKYTSPRCGTYD